MSASTVAPPWQRVSADLPAALRPRLDRTIQALAHHVVAAVPEFADSGATGATGTAGAGAGAAKFQRDLEDAVRTATERFLALVGTAEPALTPRVRTTFVALGAAEAREERGAEELVTALRTAARLLLRTSWEALVQLRPVSAEEVLDLSDAVTTYIDQLVAAATEGYTLQLREQAGEGDRRRQQLAGLLLGGTSGESAVRAAAAAIGWHQLDGLTAVLLPREQAREARFRYGAEGVLVERERDAVLLVRDGSRSSRIQLAETLRGRGAVVAPALPWGRVPESVRLAELARQLVSGDEGPDAAPVFAEDHLAALAAHGAPGALPVLAARRLAPLAGLPDARRERLLRTLRSWLLHWGSRADVSAELYVHPQTITYRLRRLRELFGDELDDPVIRFELLLVLSVGVSDAR